MYHIQYILLSVIIIITRDGNILMNIQCLLTLVFTSQFKQNTEKLTLINLGTCKIYRYVLQISKNIKMEC